MLVSQLEFIYGNWYFMNMSEMEKADRAAISLQKGLDYFNCSVGVGIDSDDGKAILIIYAHPPRLLDIMNYLPSSYFGFKTRIVKTGKIRPAIR